MFTASSVAAEYFHNKLYTQIQQNSKPNLQLWQNTKFTENLNFFFFVGKKQLDIQRKTAMESRDEMAVCPGCVG